MSEIERLRKEIREKDDRIDDLLERLDRSTGNVLEHAINKLPEPQAGSKTKRACAKLPLKESTAIDPNLSPVKNDPAERNSSIGISVLN